MKNKVITVRAEASDRKILKKLADKIGESPSVIIRMALREFAEKRLK